MSNSETGKTINGNNLLQSDPQRVSNKRHNIDTRGSVCP